MSYQYYTEEAVELSKKIEEKISWRHREIEQIAELNQLKVLQAFKNNKISDSHFNPSTGYGYDDNGRDALEAVYADTFKADAALVRPQIISGTHAINIALFGVLRPGDELHYITGKPYDTLEEIIGLRGSDNGSLKDFGIHYQQTDLKDGKIDIETVLKNMNDHTKVIGIQRSKGYAVRPSFTIKDIRKAVSEIRKHYPEVIVFVDNCYGEFVEAEEPIEAGADLIAGSLIKNPGGGLAKTGGYLAGQQRLIDLCAYRMTSPGIGAEAGASLNALQEMYQGFFLAPHVVSQALKGAVYTSALLEEAGMATSPAWNDYRTDLIQAVEFHDREKMIAFCQGVQEFSPVNAHFTPYPDYMPGYEDDVIMAAGTFVQGSSIELSADGPLRPPYAAYIQGGLTYEHIKIAITAALQKMNSL
ncbi:aminotransferase class I/II-fold pyridoxal phosphate-dependent enzyme [Jeotgalibacillus haloalkalitolerans]|uniref:Methionine gamma-lyase family protein n=1 Tax=Jeotgalibacillus haloalkalitolerans TaxID=3104292 RepID=A0ABU5KKM2_9BACL|nr:methionine gamma-lyase family protein [Jeotgalibacillus sp. HH7-29]MDZ5711815.1 methionine gamma-lyase family protein [Jeotgalibacillus sp. HH7-29]